MTNPTLRAGSTGTLVVEKDGVATKFEGFLDKDTSFTFGYDKESYKTTADGNPIPFKIGHTYPFTDIADFFLGDENEYDKAEIIDNDNRLDLVDFKTT